MKKKYIVIVILSVIALFNATYLSQKAYYQQFDHMMSGNSVCDISSTMSCSLVLQSPYSKVFGVPFPYIALFVYPIILIIALMGAKRGTTSNAKFLSVISLMGMLFNFFVMYCEIVYVKAFCPLCSVCTLIIITIFILSVSILKKSTVQNMIVQ